MGCDKKPLSNSKCATYFIEFDELMMPGESRTFPCTKDVSGCVVSLHKEGLGGKDYWPLKLCEVEVYGTSLLCIRNDEKLRQL